MARREAVEIEVRPPWPYRLPRRGGKDGVMRSRGGVVARLLSVDGRPVIVRAWQRRGGAVRFRAEACGDERDRLATAIERMRFALGVDEDLRPFHRRFRRDPVLGPAIARRPWLRPRRRPWPWEALAWAITEQLIEAGRAAAIQRRVVRRWGSRADSVGGEREQPLRDVPGPAVVARRAPAELVACDLSGARAIALIRCAREVATGRVDLGDRAGDRRLLRIREVGPWTLQCLALAGRGDHDSLPAGDLAYLKLVGRLAGLGRRATVPEVEEFFAGYAPYRGLAGTFAVAHYHLGVPAGPPLRLAA